MSGPAYAPAPAPSATETEFVARDGLRLFLRRWEPQEAPRAVAVICHGGFEHGGRYAHVAAALNERGFRCYAGDLRGCGRSAGLKGHVDDFSEYVGDLGEFVARAAAESPDLPIALIGHSMGGLVSLLYLQGPAHEAIRAAVISAPLLRLAFEPPPWKTAAGRLLAGVLPRLRLAHGLDVKGLSRDPEVVRAYEEDPLVFGRCSTRWYTAMVEAMARANSGPPPKVPTLWIHGEADPINHVDGTRSLLARLGEAGGRLIVYPGMLHEVMNEVGRERVLADVVEFLVSHVASGGGGEASAGSAGGPGGSSDRATDDHRGRHGRHG